MKKLLSKCHNAEVLGHPDSPSGDSTRCTKCGLICGTYFESDNKMKRDILEKLTALIGAILVGIGVYFAPPIKLGAVQCSGERFSGKPTTLLTSAKDSDIVSVIKLDSRVTQNINSVIQAIDTKQANYKALNGYYFKGGATSDTIPVLGNTVSLNNADCKNKDAKSWNDFAILNAPLPFTLGVAPYQRGIDEGYTIEFFVQKNGRTFTKAVSRGFEATQRTYDWTVTARTDGFALNTLKKKDIAVLKKLFKPYYAYAVDDNSRDFEESNGDYAQAADSADLSLAGAYTFDFEMNAESIAAGGANRIISKLGAAGSRTYQLSLSSATAMALVHSSDGTATSDTTINFTTTFVTGTWYRVTVTHDGSGNITAYVNCTSEFTGTNATSALNDNAGVFRLGAQSNASDAQTVEKFDGLLNNVAIYKAVVTPTSANESDSINLGHADLVAYWDLENSGTDSATADANSDTLTFTGAVNSTTVAGTLCAAASTVGDESLFFGDIF